MKTTLYFAYGSNLDPDQMKARCPSAVPVGTAFLPGYRLDFAGHSHSWDGGVATIVPRPGGRVQGLLYRITLRDLHRLDRFEGYPRVYQRTRLEVTRPDGRCPHPHVYCLGPSRSAPPGGRYVTLIWRAYGRLGFNRTALVRATVRSAMKKDTTPNQHLVFVYGTLRRGERNHDLLADATFVRMASTEPQFTLYDLGSFPAMVEGGTTSVIGEVYSVDDQTLATLDRLEGHPDFYRRSLLTLSGGKVAATYLFAKAPRSGLTIVSGDWVGISFQDRD